MSSVAWIIAPGEATSSEELPSRAASALIFAAVLGVALNAPFPTTPALGGVNAQPWRTERRSS